MASGSPDYAALCEAVSALPPEQRRRLVEEALAHGYAAKDLAEIMAVSPPAVSRYAHGSLAPSPGAICRLILGVDEETRRTLLRLAARQLWSLLEAVLQAMNPLDAAELAEEIADHVAELLAETRAPTREKHRENSLL